MVFFVVFSLKKKECRRTKKAYAKMLTAVILVVICCVVFIFFCSKVEKNIFKIPFRKGAAFIWDYS